MTLPDVLQVGSRLFKFLGSPAGQMAIYPKQDPDGGWHLLVKFDSTLTLFVMPESFEDIPVQYVRY